MYSVFKDKKLITSIYYGIKSAGRSGLSELVRALNSALFKVYEIQGNAEGVVCCSPSQSNRKDYCVLFQTVIEQCQSPKSVISIKMKRKFSKNSIGRLLCHLSYIKYLSNVELPSELEKKAVYYCNWITKITLYFKLIECMKIEESIQRLDWSKVKMVFVLSDVWTLEHIFLEYAKTKKIITITGQHALFNPSIVHGDRNSQNFWDCSADILFAYGKSTKELFHKYSPKTKVIICGNPLMEPLYIKENNKKIGIVLDSPYLIEYNKTMLFLVSHYAKIHNLMLEVRIHPSDKKENYKIYNNYINWEEDLEDCEWIIGHTTTMLFSYMARGKKVLHYKSDYITFEFPKSICFSNEEELENALKNNDREVFHNISKDRFAYISSESKERYKKAFQEIYQNLS